MNKRGQITIFIILGIIVVAIVGFVLYQKGIIIKTTTTTETGEKFVSSQIEPIKKYVQDCVKISSIKGLLTISKQGGYYDPVKYIELGNYKVSYDCYKSGNSYANNLPLIEDMDIEFQQYMDSANTREELNKCIANFKPFKEKGLNINQGTLKVTSGILFDKVIININYPLEISKGGYTATVQNMFIDIPVALGRAHKVASDIVNVECNNQDFDIDGYINANEPLATIEMQEYQNNLYVYLTTITKANEISVNFHFIIEK